MSCSLTPGSSAVMRISLSVSDTFMLALTKVPTSPWPWLPVAAGKTDAAEDVVEEAVHLAMKREEGITGKHSAAGTEGDHGIAGHRAVLLIRCGIRGGAIVPPRKGATARQLGPDGAGAGRRRLTRYGTSRHRDQPAPGRAQAAKD